MQVSLQWFVLLNVLETCERQIKNDTKKNIDEV